MALKTKTLLCATLWLCMTVPAWAFTPISQVIWDKKTIQLGGDLYLNDTGAKYPRTSRSGVSYNKALLQAAAIWNNDTQVASSNNPSNVKIVYDNTDPGALCQILPLERPGEALPNYPKNSVGFDDIHCLCIYQKSQTCTFGTDELAVTVYYMVTNSNTGLTYLRWATLNFNSRIGATWDVFDTGLNDPANSGFMDFRRVAVHELGHLLGLDHPPLSPVPNPLPIMWRTTSDVVRPLADDTTGVNTIYLRNRSANDPPPAGALVPPSVVTDEVEFPDNAADKARLRASISPNSLANAGNGDTTIDILYSETIIDPRTHLDQTGLVKAEFQKSISTYNKGTFSGNQADDVFHDIDGLVCGGKKVYYYLAVARNAQGVSTGKLQSFYTPKCNLEQIVISGPPFIEADQTGQYSAQGYFRNLNAWQDIAARWEVNYSEASVDTNGMLTASQEIAGEAVTLTAKFDHENATQSGSSRVPVLWLSNGKAGFGAAHYASDSIAGGADNTHYQPVGGSYAEGLWLQQPPGNTNSFIADVSGDKMHDLILLNNATLNLYNRYAGTNTPDYLIRKINLSFTSSTAILEDVDGDDRYEIIVGSKSTGQAPALKIQIFSYDSATPLKTIGGPPAGKDSEMRPIAYLGANRLLVMFRGGAAANDPRGLAMYDSSSGAQLWFYPTAPDPKEVAITADAAPVNGSQYLLLAGFTTNKTGGTVTAPSGGQVAALLMDDTGAERALITVRPDATPEAAVSGTSYAAFVQDVDTMQMVVAVTPDYTLWHDAFVKTYDLSGAPLKEQIIGTDKGVRLAVSDLDYDDVQDILILNQTDVTLQRFNTALELVAERSVIGTNMFVSDVDMDTAPSREILIWKPDTLQIIDAVSMAEQAQYAFPGQIITSVNTGDLSQNRGAEIMMSTQSGRVYVMRAGRGSNNPPRLLGKNLSTEVGHTVADAMTAEDGDENDKHTFFPNSQPQLGTLFLFENGTFTYIPRDTGVEHIAVGVEDAAGAISSAELVITITQPTSYKAPSRTSRVGAIETLTLLTLAALLWLRRRNNHKNSKIN